MAQPPPGHYPIYPPIPPLNPVPVPGYSHPMPWPMPMPMPAPMPPNPAPPPIYVGAPANPVGSKRRRDEGGATAAAEDESAAAAKRRAVAQDVIVRIVVPSRQIGKVIGKEGCRIQRIRDETKATVKIADAIVRHEERVIIISSKDNDNNVTDAENALQKIATLILQGVKGLIGGGPPFR